MWDVWVRDRCPRTNDVFISTADCWSHFHLLALATRSVSAILAMVTERDGASVSLTTHCHGLVWENSLITMMAVVVQVRTFFLSPSKPISIIHATKVGLFISCRPHSPTHLLFLQATRPFHPEWPQTTQKTPCRLHTEVAWLLE